MDAAEAIYRDQPNPAGWHPFDDTLEVLGTLSASGVPIGVVSDSAEKDAGAAGAGVTALTLPTHSGIGDRGLRHALKLAGF